MVDQEPGANQNMKQFTSIEKINIGILMAGTAPLTGERAQATLRGRPRGRLGKEGSGNGCLRGRPRGRFGMTGSQVTPLRRPVGFGSIQGAGATLYLSNS